TLRKFPPVPARTPRRSIRRTENIPPGDRKREPASKPINGGSSSKIDNREILAIRRTNLIAPSEASRGSRVPVKADSLVQPQIVRTRAPEPFVRNLMRGPQER